MGLGSGFGRIAGAATVALTGLAMAAPAASADYHLMKIREVALSPASNSFIELQMYAPGQNNLTGHTVTFYGPTGSLQSTSPLFPSGVPNGENQRTILIGDDAVAGRDFAYDMMFEANGALGPGGAACFENIDCVSWGSFTGAAALPSPPGSPAPAIPNGSSLERSITPNCPTLLENADDTNNSLADFFVAAPSPRNNATAPTETACATTNPGGGPDTKIDKGPKKKTKKKKKAVFEFSSTTPGVTFECEVNGAKAFTPCASPFSVKVKKGKHTFRVRAVLNGVADGSPAEYKWRVKKKKTK